jgi:hypothetical protein
MKMTNVNQETLIILGIGEGSEMSKDELNKINEIVMYGEILKDTQGGTKMNDDKVYNKKSRKYYNELFLANERLERKQKERFFGKANNNHKYGKIKR